MKCSPPPSTSLAGEGYKDQDEDYNKDYQIYEEIIRIIKNFKDS